MTKILSYYWQSLCGRYSVTISPYCINKMFQMARDKYPNEVGTSLIGYYSFDGFDAYIEDIALLSPDSIGTNSFFYRGVKGLKLFYKKLSERYKGERYYLGDWHSHPNGSPSPSRTDDINQMAVASDKKVDCAENILIILGGKPTESPEIGVYVYSRKKGRIDLFPIVE